MQRGFATVRDLHKGHGEEHILSHAIPLQLSAIQLSPCKNSLAPRIAETAPVKDTSPPMRVPPFAHSSAHRIITIIQPPTLLAAPPLFSRMASDRAGRPHFSVQGGDEDRLMDQTSALLEAKWTLDEDRMGLEKRFEFASYAKALVSQSVSSAV